MSYFGLRVVRGPGWKYSDEDGGEGGVGTVAGEADHDDANVPISEQVKAWRLEGDSISYKHRVECNGPNCSNKEIDGVRWECAEFGCGANFCVYCYLQVREHHDPNHFYFRNYQHSESLG